MSMPYFKYITMSAAKYNKDMDHTVASANLRKKSRKKRSDQQEMWKKVNIMRNSNPKFR